MKVTIIVAFDDDFNIGYKNSIPWNIPEDLINFKKTTTNNVCIMGRKTWESLPFNFRPLPDRKNIIISSKYWKDPDYFMKNLGSSSCLDVFSVPDFDGAMNICLNLFDDKEIFLIGGSGIFKEGLDSKFVKKMIVTHVNGVYKGDVKFPDLNWNDWKKESVIADNENFKIIEYLHV